MERRLVQFQVGGDTNKIYVALDDDGIVLTRRGDLWMPLKLATSRRIISIALWGESKDLLEALTDDGRLWAYDGDLSATFDCFAGWLPEVDFGCDGRLVQITRGPFPDTLSGLDDRGHIWRFDPVVRRQWFEVH